MSAPDMPPVSNDTTRFDIKIVVDPSRSPDERRAALDGKDVHRRDGVFEALMRHERNMASFRSMAMLQRVMAENAVTRTLAEHARLVEIESQQALYAAHSAAQQVAQFHGLLACANLCPTTLPVGTEMPATVRPGDKYLVQPMSFEVSQQDVLEDIRDLLADALSSGPTAVVSPSAVEVPVRGWKSILIAAGMHGGADEVRRHRKVIRKHMGKDPDAPIWYEGRTPCALPSKLRPWLAKVLRRPEGAPSPSSCAETTPPLSSSAEAAIKADALINEIVSVRRRRDRAEPPTPGSCEEAPEGT